MKRSIPDFKLLHEKEFNKADTLNDYIKKKRERAESLTPIPVLSKRTRKTLVDQSNEISDESLTPIPSSSKKSQKASDEQSKRSIPDFKLIHEKAFNKADTLNDYVRKKRERAETLTPIPIFSKRTRKTLVEQSNEISDESLTPIPSSNYKSQNALDR